MQPGLRALSMQNEWPTSMYCSLEEKWKTSREMHSNISKSYLQMEKVKTVCESAAFSR